MTVLAACAATSRPPPAPACPPPTRAVAAPVQAAPRVRAVAVARRRMARVEEGPATLAPRSTASATSPRAGVALALLVAEGDRVRPGDVLARVGPAGSDASRGAAVRSPIGGVVTARRVSLGEPVEASRTALFTVANLEELTGRAEVPGALALRLRVGLPVRLRVEAAPGREFASAVSRVETAMTAGGALGYGFPVANPDLALREGMPARASLELEARDDALVVPDEAVVREGDEARVFFAELGRAVARRVVTGIRQGGVTEVLDGLHGDERVIVPAARVREGDELPRGDGAE